MAIFSAVAGIVGAVAFALLVGLVAVSPKGSGLRRYLLIAGTASVCLFIGQTLIMTENGYQRFPFLWLQLLEIARNVGWILFLWQLLTKSDDSDLRGSVNVVAGVVFVTALFAACGLLFAGTGAGSAAAIAVLMRKLVLVSMLAVVVGGLILVEHLIRGTSRDARWALKHLCFGLGLIFAYDFYLYADALLFNRLDFAVWSGRGLVNAFAVPLLAISLSRNRQWDLEIFVSRRIVFQGVTLAAAGGYLITMALAGYYIQAVGGEWGHALKVAFFSAAITLLVTLFFSTQLRSRLRVFLARNFYRNKYEYGDEWLRFTRALSQSGLDPSSLSKIILQTIADLVDSPGGIILERGDTGAYVVRSHASVYSEVDETLSDDAPIVRYLETSGRPLQLTSSGRVATEETPEIPDWITRLPNVGYLVPILHDRELLAMLILVEARSGQDLDYEDVELMGTVGQQAGGYLALMRATEALGEANRFDAFNRLSAFLVHDLKNVVAQLSLIVRNAEKHRDNAEFVDDAFRTVGNAVEKMNRMLGSLRRMNTDFDNDDIVDLNEVVGAAAAEMDDRVPCPVFTPAAQPLHARGNRDRLHSVLQHLVQNAIDATPAHGEVKVVTCQRQNNAVIEVIDSGCGMDREFIAQRLFKPFDTTKGKAGMGIGAYESRHVVSSMGGQLEVDSSPGQGSRFTITLPLARTGPQENEKQSDIA
ncbi:MAG: XrtA/PEP-CTERM system histidine kinase PrsK [Gammaproteobacteria bacterium]